MKKIKILFICPGGQTYLNSPSEAVAKYINDNNDNIFIDIFNQQFRPPPNSAEGYDLIWGDSDGGGVPSKALSLAKQKNIPCYIHGEWVPPYRFEEGWSEYFNEPTDLKHKSRYLENINSMSQSNLVSLALSSTPGGFDWIKEKTGVIFKNKFLRYPACPQYDHINMERKNQIATIARVNDQKKRVNHTIEAINISKTKPNFKIVGGHISHPNVNIHSLGAFNTKEKIKIFSESKLAVQHWSGIPPAESIQQYCPVISYDIPYMRELYGDSLIWVEKDNIKQLADTIDYWLTHDSEREEFAISAYNLFINNKINVKLIKYEAKLILTNILKLIKK